MKINRFCFYIILIITLISVVSWAENEINYSLKANNELTGLMEFVATLGSPLNSDKVPLVLPEIRQKLELNYHAQLGNFLIDIAAEGIGVWGASPYVLEPDISTNFKIKETLVTFHSAWGLVMVGRYAALLPVSKDDYRYFGLLFGNSSTPIDAISLYNITKGYEYEVVFGYLNYARGKEYFGQADVDFFLAARLGWQFATDNFSLATSPSILLSDVVDSYGLGLPFRLKIANNLVEGEFAGYKMVGSSLIPEGFYPAMVLKYQLPWNADISIEAAYIHRYFLPYTGNMTNFGGSLGWQTGVYGLKTSWGYSKYSGNIKYQKDFDNVPTLSTTVSYNALPKPMLPLAVTLTNEQSKLRLEATTGLVFYF